MLINKWHRTKGSAADGTAGAEAGGSPGGASGSGGGAAGGQGGPRRRGSQLPPELAVLVPNEEAFSPELYLATFHTVGALVCHMKSLVCAHLRQGGHRARGKTWERERWVNGHLHALALVASARS